MKTLLKGRLVSLAAVNPEEISRSFSSWNRDSELSRLQDSGPARMVSAKKSQEFLDKMMGDSNDRMFWFTIRSCDG